MNTIDKIKSMLNISVFFYLTVKLASLLDVNSSIYFIFLIISMSFHIMRYVTLNKKINLSNPYIAFKAVYNLSL